MSNSPDTTALTGATHSTIYVAVEISLKSWIVGVHCPDASGGSVSIHTLAAADTAGLLDLVGSVRKRVAREVGARPRVMLTYEAGYEGFWLARDIERRDAEIDIFMNDPASLRVNRRAKKKKTDRIDARRMVRALKAWDPAIGGIDVQLVPDPGGGMALGVALGADIAGPRQVRQHLRKAHRQLPFQPAWLLRPLLSLAWPPPLAPPLRLRCLRLRRRLLPRLDRRRIPRDVLHQMAIHRPRNQRLMQTAGQTALGKLGKGPRKRRLARKPAGTAPAAQPAKPAVNLKTLDQAARRRNVEHRLGYEGARQRGTVLLRPPYLAAEVGQKSLDPYQFQNRDEQLVALAHRAKLALEPREQIP